MRASFKSMEYLVGEKFKAVKVPCVEFIPDGDVTILADYGNTFLVDMEYIKTYGWGYSKPRHIRLGIPKASIVCGDVILKRKFNNKQLTADEVYNAPGSASEKRYEAREHYAIRHGVA